MQTTATGYLHPRYAKSFAEWGTPRHLARSDGWLLERTIPGSPWRDAMGCYPLFACRDWSQLAADLDELSAEVVSVALVADPFGGWDLPTLRGSFDLVTPFKDHYVTELSRYDEAALPPRHRRNLATARRHLDVDVCERPSEHLEEWVELFDALAARHRITGLRAMSATAFAGQLETPGLVMMRATAQGRLAGIHLWCVQGDVAYGHLGATNELGYELMASYLLYARAIMHFKAGLAWVHLGGGAGTGEVGNRGLQRFKAGWATGTKPAYLCGRVLQPHQYESLAEARCLAGSTYFPAYRAGEFTTPRGECGPPSDRLPT